LLFNIYNIKYFLITIIIIINYSLNQNDEIEETKQQMINMQQKQSEDIDILNNRIEEISKCVKEKDEVINEKVLLLYLNITIK